MTETQQDLSNYLEYIDDIPQSLCPKCKRWQDDHDGFGVLKCEHCEYCSHPSADKGDDGLWRCGLCERLVVVDIG